MRSEQLWPRWPRAYPGTGIIGKLKQSAEDFAVTELAEPQGDPGGEHLYVYLEKRCVSTPVVAERIANSLGVGRAEVGYAGMKDFKAVTRQWFSAPVAESPDIDYGEGVQELRRLRCAKKLRRGQLDGNEFDIRLTDIALKDTAALDERLATLAEVGTPNYFGPQRFGRDNLTQALAWLPFRRRERNGFRRGLHLSVLRSFLFNEVLAARVQQDSWQRCLPGEPQCSLVPQPTGSFSPQPTGSFSPQPTGSFSPQPTGPLWGRGRTLAGAEVADLEQVALEEHAELLEELEFTGLTQARRGLVLRPQGLEWTLADRTLQLLSLIHI